jgi:hypothetical protein
MEEDLYILTYIICISYYNIYWFPKRCYLFINLIACKSDYSNGIRIRKALLLEHIISAKEVLVLYNIDSITNSIILIADLSL